MVWSLARVARVRGGRVDRVVHAIGGVAYRRGMADVLEVWWLWLGGGIAVGVLLVQTLRQERRSKEYWREQQRSGDGDSAGG
jgi:hypothetical protein